MIGWNKNWVSTIILKILRCEFFQSCSNLNYLRIELVIIIMIISLFLEIWDSAFNLSPNPSCCTILTTACNVVSISAYNILPFSPVQYRRQYVNIRNILCIDEKRVATVATAFELWVELATFLSSVSTMLVLATIARYPSVCLVPPLVLLN